MPFEPPPNKTNRYEIRVYATVRSGHHGVMQWLKGHFPGEILQRHNVSRVDWPAGPFIFTEYNKFNEVGAPLPHTRPWSRELYLLNVEDANLETVRRNFDENRWHTFNGMSHRIVEVLVLRDPYNCFASIYRALGPFPLMGTTYPGGQSLYVERGSVIEIWKQHAREFLESRLVPGAIKINFTQWMLSQAYRKSIAEEAMGLHFTDKEFGVRGMSSSFDGKFEDARHLKLFDRWRVFEMDQTFRKFFDAEVHDLATKIFGEVIAEPRSVYS